MVIVADKTETNRVPMRDFLRSRGDKHENETNSESVLPLKVPIGEDL